MVKMNVAIIGLGRVGSVFFEAMRNRRNINIVCLAERAETPAKANAATAGFRIATLDEVIGMGDAVDLIFDLTGLPAVRQELREKLRAASNAHTVIATESVVRVMWSLVSEEELPLIEGRKIGY